MSKKFFIGERGARRCFDEDCNTHEHFYDWREAMEEYANRQRTLAILEGKQDKPTLNTYRQLFRSFEKEMISWVSEIDEALKQNQTPPPPRNIDTNNLPLNFELLHKVFCEHLLNNYTVGLTMNMLKPKFAYKPMQKNYPHLTDPQVEQLEQRRVLVDYVRTVGGKPPNYIDFVKQHVKVVKNKPLSKDLVPLFEAIRESKKNRDRFYWQLTHFLKRENYLYSQKGLYFNGGYYKRPTVEYLLQAVDRLQKLGFRKVSEEQLRILYREWKQPDAELYKKLNKNSPAGS